MSHVVVLSHTYVEAENRGKLRAMASSAPVTAVVPSRWREGAFGRAWQLSDGSDGNVRIVATRWLGPLSPSRGVMAVPARALQRDAILQIEEEPWTPTARFALGRGPFARRVLFTWENIDRRMPPPWSWWRRTVLRSLDGLITGNTAAGEIAKAQGFHGPTVVIPQLGVDLPARRRPSERGALRIAFVGRLVPEKGVDVLLRALNAGWHLDILGDGPERPALERLAGELGIGAQVRFLGARPHAEVAALWPEVDGLVLPSRTTPSWREQLGHVLLEAMAHEVAVVGSSSGAIPEVIGDAGLIVPEGDHLALRAQLERLADRATLARLAAAGRGRVEALYSNERIAARTRDFHAAVLAVPIMCGIVMLYRAGGQAVMEPMLKSIRHRGPDDDGIIECGDTTLGARRLAIIDLPGGHQPLANEQRNVWVAFNGEIYNHAALHETLRVSGHRFATASDTEVLVHGYEEWGIEGLLGRLRGMFAFALADMRTGACLLARDRLGKKPLYLARVGAGWAAASEIKSLFLHPGIAPEIDQSRIPESLANRFVTGGRTLFANVTKLLPGHWMKIDRNGADTHRYWEPPAGTESVAGRDIPAEVRAQVDEAVKLRLIADVPLGALLSGGLDSSVIAAAMKHAGASPLRTYTVGFEPAEGDEREAARVVAEHLGTDHTERVVAIDTARQLDEVVWHADEPLGDAAALPTMLICRAAREHVTVVLSGEGADELFLGYPRYLLVRLAERARSLPSALRKPLLLAGAQLARGRVRRAMRRLADAPQDALVRSALWMSGAQPETIAALCRMPALNWERWYVPEGGERGHGGTGARHDLEDVIRRDMSAWLVDDILLKLDKMSMAASLEARAPFLDHQLVEFVCRLDVEARFAARGKKWLRQAYEADLPDTTRRRAKHPFRAPVAAWMRGALGLELEAAVGRPSSFAATFLDRGVARSLIEQHRRGADHSLLLWNLLVHEAWWRRFFGGPGVAA